MITFIREIGWFVKKNWLLYLLTISLGIVNALLILYPTMLIGEFISYIEDNIHISADMLLWLVGRYLGTIVGIYIVIAAKRICQFKLSIGLYADLQVSFLEKILYQDAVFFEHFQAGDLLTRALGDVRAVRMSGVNRIINIFLESMSIVIVLCTMLFINWQLTLICIIPFPFVFVFNFFFRRVIKKNWRNVRNASSELGNNVLESITNVRTIRAFSKEEENYRKLIEYSERVFQIEKKNLKVNSAFMPIFQSIAAISTILVYWFGTQMILNSTPSLDVEELIMLTMYLNMFAFPLMRIGNMINNFYESMISLDRLNEIYRSKVTVADRENALELDHIDSIEYKDVKFKYENDKDFVLKGISIRLKLGETLGIVGKTGSGKSTLVRQLLRQYPLEHGQLYFNGIPVADYRKESIRAQIGYVPQEHILFSRTVMENIMLGSIHEVDKENVNDAILKADLNKDIPYLPYGLETVVGEYGVTLSGGQKQRLAIARAFIKEADLLVLDDSLSAVDGKTEANIIKNLQKYRSTKANIIVSHRMTAIMHANKIIVLDNGLIVEAGTHDELMSLRGWYYMQFTEQMMKEGEIVG